MKIERLMERIGITETGKGITYIKDALEEMNILTATHVNTERIDITEDQRFYDIPNEAVKVLDVKVKNHLNSKDEYRSIPRMIYEPEIEDANNDGDDI